MARSAFVEVNITNPTRLAQDSQDTANKAVKGVTDLNDPNLMSVIEKQNNIVQFAGLTSQLNVLVQNAKDDGIDTAAVTTAYNNLNTFMADILADPNHASDIDRTRYKKYQDAYNEELAKLQNALQNNTNDKFTSAASALSQAASTANVAKSAADSTYAYANSEIAVQSTATAKAQSAADGAFSQAQVVGSQASSEIAVQSTATAKAQSTADNAFSKAQEVGSQASAEIAVQSNATAKAQSTADNAFSKAQAVGSQASAEINSNSTATAKAQSTADNAFSQATTAIDNGKVTSQAVTDLKDGSKLTIAELENGLATKVANSDYASYKEQTASQIGQLVTNGAFSAYQTQTADLIAQKVATSDFSAYQATTAKAIESKVESKDFNTYKTQTADLIDDKVSSSQYSSDKTQTASEIADRVSNSAFSTYQTQTASQIASKVDNGDFSTYKTQTANLIGSKVDNGVYQSDKTQTANAISSKVSSSDFNTYKTQTADLIDEKVSNSAYASDKTQTASEIADRVSNSAFSTYQTQTASQIASKVDNGAFSTYKTQTADLIASKVANKDFSAYQATTAKSIESKVESKDFNTYKSQTADLINDKVSNSEYASDKTQTASQISQMVSNSAFSAYQTQTASQIAQTVSNSAFSAYQQTTADLIASKVTTKDFKAYQDITAEAISSKVESSDFNTYKTQTAGMISSKVSNGDFSTYKTQTANDINLRVEKKGLIAEINMQAGNTLISTSGQLTLSGKNILLDSNDPVIMKSANIDTLLVGKKLTAADISANTFTTNNGTFTVDKSGLVTATSLVIRGSTNLVYNASLSGANGAYIPGWDISNGGGCWISNTHDGVPSIGFHANTGAGVWNIFAQTKLHPLNGDVYQPFSASVWFKEYGSDTSLRWNLTLAFFDSNGNRIEGAYGGQSWNGIGSEQGWRYVTVENVTPPSNAVSVGLQYFAYNGNGNACFSSPMLTQTAQSTGYQPDTGNVVSAGIINGSVINGSTINGTTFNAGDIINNANNTSHFYPTTISNNGHIYTTWFNPVDAMQTDLSTGALTTKYRAVNSSNNQYEAYDTMIQANQIALFAGHTNGKDMSFAQSVTGSNQDGYVLLSPLNGMTLHGDNQQITFNGTSDDATPKGIIITPYGNINPNGTQNIWYVGNGPAMKTASFGINADQNVPISLYRQTLVDEIGALGNRLDMGRLFLHATDNNAQMYLLNDGSPAFVSPTVYNRTYSNGANMFVTSAGRVGRSTSASKYKLAIARSDDTLQADRLMTLKPASWNDKIATEKMAESLSNGEIPVEAEINLRRHYGLIAEDLRDAGLDEFLITGKDGQIEGIEYDRLWTVLIPKIKQLNNRINELERKTL